MGQRLPAKTGPRAVYPLRCYQSSRGSSICQIKYLRLCATDQESKKQEELTLWRGRLALSRAYLFGSFRPSPRLPPSLKLRRTGWAETGGSN
jgi:hypothetical protein